MKQFRCPSCGASYNGKLCRQCGYEHFSQEISRGRPQTGSLPRKNSRTAPKKARKKRPFLGLFVIFLIIGCLLPLVRSWGQKLEVMENSHFQPEPEYFPIPEDALLLYEEGGIQILAHLPQEEGLPTEFPIYVCNGLSRDVLVSGADIRVNGTWVRSGLLWCAASAGTPGKGTFSLDQQELLRVGIQTVEELAFRLDIYDSEQFELLDQSPVITLQIPA